MEAQNISFLGLGFSHNLGPDSLKPGQTVRLGLVGHNDVDATICWADEKYAGVKFSESVDELWESWAVRAIEDSKAQRVT